MFKHIYQASSFRMFGQDYTPMPWMLSLKGQMTHKMSRKVAYITHLHTTIDQGKQKQDPKYQAEPAG
jgi:hypothetical protein|uniref:Uncharacterized protein n=1 Tax=viral metagenome TaxID=1070528 RepID=A0A6C0B0L4_9ZZZZ